MNQETLQELFVAQLRDLAIIAAAQRVEHYEISAYGTARTLAEHLGLKKRRNCCSKPKTRKNRPIAI